MENIGGLTQVQKTNHVLTFRVGKNSLNLLCACQHSVSVNSRMIISQFLHV